MNVIMNCRNEILIVTLRNMENKILLKANSFKKKDILGLDVVDVELEGVFVEIESGPVADAHVQRHESSIERFDHRARRLVHQLLGESYKEIDAYLQCCSIIGADMMILGEFLVRPHLFIDLIGEKFSYWILRCTAVHL